MDKIYHLSTCDTCQRIIGQIGDVSGFDLIDIKYHPISEEDLDAAARQLGGYESLFNKRARKYRAQGLHQQTLSDADYKSLILNEYTFLKRPLILYKGSAFAGNSKKVIDSLIEVLR